MPNWHENYKKYLQQESMLNDDLVSMTSVSTQIKTILKKIKDHSHILYDCLTERIKIYDSVLIELKNKRGSDKIKRDVKDWPEDVVKLLIEVKNTQRVLDKKFYEVQELKTNNSDQNITKAVENLISVYDDLLFKMGRLENTINNTEYKSLIQKYKKINAVENEIKHSKSYKYLQCIINNFNRDRDNCAF